MGGGLPGTLPPLARVLSRTLASCRGTFYGLCRGLWGEKITQWVGGGGWRHEGCWENLCEVAWDVDGGWEEGNEDVKPAVRSLYDGLQCDRHCAGGFAYILPFATPKVPLVIVIIIIINNSNTLCNAKRPLPRPRWS